MAQIRIPMNLKGILASRPTSWTAVARRSRDTAFERAKRVRVKTNCRACESGVALRFPPQSKTVLDLEHLQIFFNGLEMGAACFSHEPKHGETSTSPRPSPHRLRRLRRRGEGETFAASLENLRWHWPNAHPNLVTRRWLPPSPSGRGIEGEGEPPAQPAGHIIFETAIAGACFKHSP